MPVDDVIAAVPELRGATSVEPLPGGLTNQNYCVTASAGRFHVRCWGRDTGLLGIDRENELHNAIAAAETGVAPRVVSALPELGAMVVEFLVAETLSADALRRGDRLGIVAAACKRLHGSRPFLREFDMFELTRGYLAIVDERGFRLPDGYRGYADAMAGVARALRARPEPRVPCNNDLLAENLLDTGGEIRIIDFEYSGNNEPSFELGNIWSESNLAPEQLDELVAHYYRAPSREKVARARLWGLAAKYGWMLWASIQASVSELDFDFWSWGLEKYERAVAELEGPDFERLLADVRTPD